MKFLYNAALIITIMISSMTTIINTHVINSTESNSTENNTNNESLKKTEIIAIAPLKIKGEILKKTINITKKTAKAALYSIIAMGAITNCAISTFGLFFIFKNLKIIQPSFLSNVAIILIKHALKTFGNIPDIYKYIIPVATFTLTTSMLSSCYVAYSFFKKTYNTIKN